MRFFRPLSSLSHYAELSLWPQATWAMHASNVAIYLLLVATAALVHPLLGTPPKVAALAALIFAIDDAHAGSVGWISARNTLLSAAFGLASFHAYLRGSWLGPLALGAGLLSGEGALQVAGYLLAHALLLDHRRARERVLALAPYACVLALWAGYCLAHGYGARGSDWYRTPTAANLLAGAWDLPLWIGGMLIASFASASLLYDGLATHALWIVALGLVAPPLVATLRDDSRARFYALGAALACAPLLLTRPQDRLLLIPSFGAAGWLALTLAARERFGGYARRAASVLGALHLGLSPLLFPALLGQVEPLERSARALADALSGSAQTVIVNLPMDVLHNNARSQLRATGREQPRHSYVLYAGSSQLQIERPDARSLLVRADPGWLSDSFERLLATLTPGFSAEQRWQLPGMHVQVVRVNARRAPKTVRFTFPTALEDEARRWLYWNGRRPAVWQPPAIGQTVRLPALSPLSSLTPR